MDVIATRELRLVGKRKKVLVVKLGRPKELPGGSDWLCPFEISGKELCVRSFAGGVDGFQALQYALGMIGAKVNHLNKTEFEGQLRWVEDKDPDLGFIIPQFNESKTSCGRASTVNSSAREV